MRRCEHEQINPTHEQDQDGRRGHWGEVGLTRKKSNRMQKIWDFLVVS